MCIIFRLQVSGGKFARCVCVGSSIHACVSVCVCSCAAQPGFAPYLYSSIQEGFLLQRPQPELPLQEKHRALLGARVCGADTASGVRKSHNERSAAGSAGRRQRRGGGMDARGVGTEK